jgi:hypothetical protein
MKADTLRRLDSKIRSTAPRRFALGIAWGVVLVLGMWLISALNHAEKFGLGLTWQVALTVVLLMGFLQLGAPHQKK